MNFSRYFLLYFTNIELNTYNYIVTGIIAQIHEEVKA